VDRPERAHYAADSVQLETSVSPTVGRESELALLDSALDAVAQGTPACVALEGEPGIGKTRLLSELRRRAEARGWLVLAGAAAEFERDLPFSVWVDALDAYVASQELDPGDAELASVLPSLRAADAEVGDSLADERYRAHRAVTRLLAALAASRPLVLVLDDLHWSDGSSIELLAALLRRGVDAPVLLALAFRPGHAASRLSPALAAPSVRRVTLQPLDEAHANELLGDGVDPLAAAAIYRHGGGNPFYLEQLARASRDGRLQGAIGGADGDAPALGVPAAVAASLAEEVASLAAQERTLLEAAAVAGDPFEPDLAAAIAELPAGDGLTALDGLLAQDLVRPTAVPRRFVFRHPLVRRAVYEAVPGGWKLGAHARAAATLAARGAASTERAHHVEHSASRGDEDAIALLLQAGAETAPRAPSAAARWFEAALRLLPAEDRRRQVEVRIALAGTLRSLGELERCRATLLEALELLPAGAAAERVELTARCAAVEHWLGRHDDAHQRLARVWDELSDRSTPAAAALQLELVVDGFYELDLEQSVASGRGALDAARAIYYLGWAENYLEHYDAAEADVDRGIAIARASGEGRLLIPMMLVKGYTFEMQGRCAESIALCEAAVEATRLSASTHELFWALWELAHAHYFAGGLEAAIAAAEESAEVGGRLAGGTMPASGGGPGWVLAMSMFEAGEVEQAWKIMQGLGSDDLPHKIPVEKCFDWEVLALAELARGHVEAADGYARRAEEHAAALGLRVPVALALRTRAAVLLARGEPLEAARLSRESAETAAAAGARLPAAFSVALAGRALAAAGDREQAIAALREAERELDACGSVRVRDEMRRELRRLGARAEPRGPSAGDETGVGALSKRELEIAELVCDRKTNREIAAALFLSEKTIESHMRNIFHKLGADSRVKVARAIERERRNRGAAP
jgi:DNA-binding CsgD family transcriptional regulator